MNVRFLKNTSWIIGGQIIKSLLGFIVSIFTAKYLGPSNSGIIGYVTSIITLFTSFANLGLANIIVKEIINNKGREGTVIGTAITMQLISSVICYGLVVLMIVLLNRNDSVMFVCALLQSFSLIFSSFDHISYYYQSRLESKFTTIITMVAYFIMQLFKIYLLATNKPVELFAFAYTLDYIIVVICLIISYIKNKGPKWQFSFKMAKTLIKQSYPMIFAGTITAIYGSLDRIMLKEILHTTEFTGYYNMAYTLSHVWQFVVTAFITSFAPLIYAALYQNGQDDDSYKIKVRQLYWVIFWIGAMASVFLNIISPWFIKAVYGEMYNMSIVPTMFLTWAAIFSSMGSARNIQCVCEDKKKYIILFGILSLGINALLNAILIPRLTVVGAAIATLVSEFFVCIIAPLFFKQTRNIAVNILQGIAFKGVNIKQLIHNIKSKIFKKKTPATPIEQGEENSTTPPKNEEESNVDNAVDIAEKSDNIEITPTNKDEQE